MGGAMSWPFLRLYGLTLLYFSANSILNVIIPLKGESVGAANTTIGIIMGAYLFTTMLFRPWAGHIIQKHGAIKVLRTILLINGCALMLYTMTGLGGYFAARMLQGVCTAFFSMALQLGIIDALPDKDRSQGISMYSLCSYIPGIFGPLLALGIWQSGDMNMFTAAMVVMAVLTGAVGFSARIERKERAPEPASGSKGIGATMFASYGQLFTNAELFRCSVLMLTASLVFGAVTTFMPLYASTVPGGNAGVYLMLQASTVVLSRFLLKKRIPSDGRWHPAFVIGIFLALSAASLSIGLSGMFGAWLLYSGAVLMGGAQALLYPALTSYLSFVLPAHNRNVLLGLFIAMADLGVSMSGVTLGLIADTRSYSVMYIACACIGAAMILCAAVRRSVPAEMKPSTGA